MEKLLCADRKKIASNIHLRSGWIKNYFRTLLTARLQPVPTEDYQSTLSHHERLSSFSGHWIKLRMENCLIYRTCRLVFDNSNLLFDTTVPVFYCSLWSVFPSSIMVYCDYYKFLLVEELLLGFPEQFHYGKCSVIGRFSIDEDSSIFLNNIKINSINR